jgi:hypothetical protein
MTFPSHFPSLQGTHPDLILSYALFYSQYYQYSDDAIDTLIT